MKYWFNIVEYAQFNIVLFCEFTDFYWEYDSESIKIICQYKFTNFNCEFQRIFGILSKIQCSAKWLILFLILPNPYIMLS